MTQKRREDDKLMEILIEDMKNLAEEVKDMKETWTEFWLGNGREGAKLRLDRVERWQVSASAWTRKIVIALVTSVLACLVYVVKEHFVP